jgi:PIN domain nuclease of toxin-antitoxin system
MKLLLDTHAFLWLRSEPEKIPQSVLDAYYNINNDVFLSMASIWEIQIKHQLGKLELNIPLQQLIDTQTQQNGLKILPITPTHIYALNTIPFHHKDPFDRLLIVQARLEHLQLASVDRVFGQYQVDLFWQ